MTTSFEKESQPTPPSTPGRRPWPRWAGVLLWLAAALTLGYELSVLVWLSFGLQGSPEDVARVTSSARQLTFVIAAPWGLAALVTRRVWVMARTVVCVAPALVFWLDARTPGPWF